MIRNHGLAFLVPGRPEDPEDFKPQHQGGVGNIMEDFYRNTFSYILDCYKNEKFCDVRIFARPESFSKECNTDESYVGGNLQSISCHSLVLASVAPALKEILLVPESLDTKNNQDVRYVRMYVLGSMLWLHYICTFGFAVSFFQSMSMKSLVYLY